MTGKRRWRQMGKCVPSRKLTVPRACSELKGRWCPVLASVLPQWVGRCGFPHFRTTGVPQAARHKQQIPQPESGLGHRTPPGSGNRQTYKKPSFPEQICFEFQSYQEASKKINAAQITISRGQRLCLFGGIRSLQKTLLLQTEQQTARFREKRQQNSQSV